MFWRGKLAAEGRDGFYEEELECRREFCGREREGERERLLDVET